MFVNRVSCALFLIFTAVFGAAAQEKPASVSYPHQIDVMVFDAYSGKAVKGAWVSLRGVGVNAETNWPQSVQSNAEGVAKFSLVDPIPEKVMLFFEANEFASCIESGFSTERILKSGLAAGSFCTAPKVYSLHTPQSGQLVVYGRSVSAWDRFCNAVPFFWLFR